MSRVSTDGSALVMVGLAGALIGIVALTNIPVGAFHDDGQYVILARSLAEHGTYRFDNLPGAPPGLHYPPGFPAFLALFWLVNPGNVLMLRVANAALLGGAAIAIMAFARRIFSLRNGTAAAVSLAVIAADRFLWLNGLLVSETLFVVALYTTFTLAVAKRDSGPRWQFTVGLLAGATALVRSLADPLGPLLAIERLVRGKRRDAAFVASAWFVAIAPWKIWLHVHADGIPGPIAGAYGEYGAWWHAALSAEGAGFVWATLKLNVSQLAITLSAFGWASAPLLRDAAALVFLGTVALGVFRAWRESRVVVAYAAAYVGVVMIWPYEPDRFLWMLAPAAVAAFASGAVTVVAALRTAPDWRVSPRTWLAVCGALLVVGGAAPRYVAAFRDRPWENGLRDRATKGAAASRLVLGLPQGARIATDFDELVSLRTGRVVVPASGLTAQDYVRSPADSVVAMRLDRVLTAFAITHIVIADATTLHAVQWLQARGAPLAAVASDSAGAVVFARLPRPHGPAAPDAASPSPTGK